MRKLIVIIVFLLCVQIASATIIVRSIEGSEGIKNYRTANDTILINISSTSGNITINDNPANCQNSGFNYACLVNDEQNNPVASYIIKNQENNEVTATINVDNSIGAISYSLSSSNGNVTLNYDITDTAYNNGAGCSGLDHAEVFWMNSNTDNIDLNTSNCNAKASMFLTITDSATAEFYIKVYDKLGNIKTSEIKNITLDVDAPEVTDLKIMKNGLELDTIAQHTDIVVDVGFTVIDQELSSIIADISNINYNPAINQQYKNINVPLSSCILNDSRYSCVIKDKILRINKDSVNVTITATDVSSNSKKFILTKNLQIDNEKPDSDIITEFCDKNNTCYVKNGVNKIIAKLTKSNFLNRNVFFEVAGKSARVSNCSGNECYGFVNINCNADVDARILTLAPFVSQDDSGNIINTRTKRFICDNDDPEIVNISIVGDRFGQLITTGSTVKMSAVIKDKSSEIFLTAKLNEMKNATERFNCQGKNTFNCTLTVNAINPGYYDANMIFSASDIANNTNSKPIKQRVLGLKADNQTPDELSIKFNKIIPRSINRIALDLAITNNIPFFSYAEYTITSKNPDAKLLYQDVSVDKCMYVTDKGTLNAGYLFSDIRVNNKYAKVGEINRIDFNFNDIDINLLDNDFRIVCNISANVQRGNFVYNKPQYLMLEVPFNLRNSRLGEPGESFVNKIKKEEEGFMYSFEVLGFVNNVLPKLQRICDLRRYTDMGSFAADAIGLVGQTVTPVIPGLSDVGMKMGVNIQSFASCFVSGNANTYLSDPMQSKNNNFCQRIVQTACTFTSCKAAENPDQLTTNIFSDEIFGEKGILKNKDLPDVQNSFVMSVAEQCWPAAVYNLNKWRQTDCGYVYCLKQASLAGTDISVCDKAKKIQTCTLIVGEIYELPYVRVGKNVINNIGDIINNIGPLSVVSLSKPMCKEYFSQEDAYELIGTGNFDKTKLYLCQIPLSIARFVDGNMRSSRGDRFYYPDVTDMCKVAKSNGASSYGQSKNIWNQLSGIRIPDYAKDEKKYEVMAANNKDVEDLIAKKKEILINNPGASELYNELLGNDELWAELEYMSEKREMSVSDFQGFLWNNNIKLSESEEENLRQLFNADTKIEEILGCLSCDAKEREAKLNAATPNIQTLTGEDLKKMDEKQLERMLVTYDNALKELEGYDTTMEESVASQSVYNRENIVKKRKRIFADIFKIKCEDDACSKYDKAQLESIKAKISDFRSIKAAEDISKTANIGLQVLYNNHMLDWMMSANWGDGIMKVVQFFDTDQWKNNLCNPDLQVVGGQDYNTGSVISCNSGSCQPVLNIAAERQEFVLANKSKYYLYTAVFYLGPVYTKDDFSYNIQFRGEQTVKGYDDEQKLGNGQLVSVAKSFAHYKKFGTICITFNNNYPPNTMGSTRQYCRPIKENAFNTGNPLETGEEIVQGPGFSILSSGGVFG
ncbi:TPA: hypothetical protein HA235_07240 [Candidatus Woesearchaeota archaeon]|nr:hypothetical protein [Candidatus Woesearchaeota archaeon]HIH32471.1 hypothetical protein [Candidatus Woesearchaeota archaeon]HIH54256.1 hypothetical protein [Candidatus Woesearchaeota archaeon]HIJ02594.1 hypothetical protein [Candidatus Woesearchaeota archaeon]HIJ13857.1 hypothetical protein [Candidatus Woesearchaeota archaeon]